MGKKNSSLQILLNAVEESQKIINATRFDASSIMQATEEAQKVLDAVRCNTSPMMRAAEEAQKALDAVRFNTSPMIQSVEEVQRTKNTVRVPDFPITNEIEKLLENSQKFYLPDLSTVNQLLGQQLDNSIKISSLFDFTKLDYHLSDSINLEFINLFQKIQLEWVGRISVIGDQVQKKFIKLEADTEEIAPVLQKSGLWLSPSMSFDFYRKIIALAKKPSISKGDVEKQYLDYFCWNDCEFLRQIVEGWRKKRFFKDRMEIIDDALEAHINKKYTLSIPTLLPLIEGIASSLSGKAAGHPKQIIKKAIGDSYPDYLTAASEVIFLDLLETIGLFGYINNQFFSPGKYSTYLIENGIQEKSCLNRHAIMHGVQLNYASEINSLKVFLILDMLSILDKRTDN